VYGDAAPRAVVSARMLSRAGAPLLPLIVAAPASPADGYEIDLPLASVARGDYLVDVAASAGDDRTEILIPLRIAS